MNAEENYHLDVAGYLIVRGALTAEQVREPDQPLHEQPVLLSYVQQLCGEGHTLSGTPEWLSAPESGPDQLRAGGHEPLDWSLAYHRQGDVRFCQTVVAVWALDDIADGDGGFVLVPASHNAQVAAPQHLAGGLDVLNVVEQPVLQAGDLLLCVGAALHGMRCWREDPKRLMSCTFVRDQVRNLTPEPVVEADWMTELTAVQRTVLGVPQRGVVHSDGTDCQLQEGDDCWHPSIFVRTPDTDIDEDEFFLWDLNGYLVLRNVMDPDWVRAACDAIESQREQLTGGGHKPPILSPALAGTPTSSLRDLFELPAPHAEPFRRMIAHPAVVQRLNWMLGGGFFLGPVRAMCYEPGSCGLFMHGSPEPAFGRNHYHLQNGRSFSESVNVAWQLVDTGPQDGGFVCIPGSHKARYPVPERLIGLDDDLGLVRHVPANAGDVVLFLGAAQTHGAYPWVGPGPRMVALLNYKSRHRT